MDVRIRLAEGQDRLVPLLWDTVWDASAGHGDWSLGGPGATGNAGGLRAEAGLHTAVILALFTDRRISEDHPLRYLAGDDRRGWWGDGIDVRQDLGEGELGSLLWVLERAPLTPEIARWAQALTEEALAPLIWQQAVVRTEVRANAVPEEDRLTLWVALYGRDGREKYRQQFEIFWNQASS